MRQNNVFAHMQPSATQIKQSIFSQNYHFELSTQIIDSNKKN